MVVVAIAHVMIAFRSAAGQVAARMVLWQQQEIQLDLEYIAMMALGRAWLLHITVLAVLQAIAVSRSLRIKSGEVSSVFWVIIVIAIAECKSSLGGVVAVLVETTAVVVLCILSGNGASTEPILINHSKEYLCSPHSLQRTVLLWWVVRVESERGQEAGVVWCMVYGVWCSDTKSKVQSLIRLILADK